jgi:hypothetical protein
LQGIPRWRSASNVSMSGTRLIKRIVTVTLMTAGFFVLLSVIKAEATPINPDIRKVLARPSQPANEFVPARAGWNGPEMPKTAPVNVTYEQLGPAGTSRRLHEALLGAFVPDYRALTGVALIILLLRRMSKSGKPKEYSRVTPLLGGNVGQHDTEPQRAA